MRANSGTVHSDTPPEAMWRVVSNIPSTGAFSAETLESEWINEGSTGPEKARRRTSAGRMQATLERLKAVVEG
jgi:hypothetical protein